MANMFKMVYRMFLCIILFLMSSGINASGLEQEFISISEIESTTSAHSTTRQFQRKVFFVNDHWFVFYTNGQDTVYRSSKDGIKWSNPGIIDKGVGHSSSIDVVFQDNSFYFFNSLDGDPDPEKWRQVMYARKGAVRDNDILWGDLHRVFEDNGNDDHFYSSVSMDEQGFVWAAARHTSPPGWANNVMVSRTLQPFSVKTWMPGAAGLKNSDGQSIAPQIIGLGNGKAYLVAKATKKGKVFGNFFDGQKWETEDSFIGTSSNVPGDDKRMSMVFEPAGKSHEGRIHMVYLDNNDILRYRVLNSPYSEDNWSPRLDKPGSVFPNANGLPIKAFTCVLAINKSTKSVKLYLLYGETKFRGKDRRQITGELRLLRFTDGNWSGRSLLISEKGATKNWYPSMIQFADEKIAILYMKGITYSFDLLNQFIPPRKIMFSSADRAEIDRYFDQKK